MSTKPAVPFDQGYVLRTTVKHMRKSVDISISKTFERLPEFIDTPKAVEVFQTLGLLHKMRKSLDEFQTDNPTPEGIFK